MLIIAFILFYINNQYIKFTIDDKEYHIERYSQENKYESLNTLVQIRKKLDMLIEYLIQKYPNDEKIKRMKKRFLNTVLREANPDGDPTQTSYTINKGDTMVICLRSDNNKVVDINTLTYVAIHELAHIYSSSYNHSDEFWENMAYLINEANDAGIYKKTNYHMNPVHYCGIVISSNIPRVELPNQEKRKMGQIGGAVSVLNNIMRRSYVV